MAAEGTIAITAAVIAGSVALLGFGLDSAIEGLASMIVVWRFTGTRTLSETAEARAQKSVAVTFFLLAPYIAYDAVTTLAGRDHARTSWLGIGLAIASLIVMPALGVAKRRLGARLDSAATAGRAHPEPAVRLPSRRGTGRAAGQHPARLVVAGPGRGAGHRRPGRTGRRRSLARRGMLLRCAGSPDAPDPAADGNGQSGGTCAYAQLRRPHLGYSARLVMRSRRRWLHLLFR